jgi:hypothetical protein
VFFPLKAYAYRSVLFMSKVNSCVPRKVHKTCRFCDVVDCSSSCGTALLRATQGPENEGRWFWLCVQSTPDRQQGHLQGCNVQRSATNKCCCCCCSVSNSLFCPLSTVTRFRTLLISNSNSASQCTDN